MERKEAQERDPGNDQDEWEGGKADRQDDPWHARQRQAEHDGETQEVSREYGKQLGQRGQGAGRAWASK